MSTSNVSKINCRRCYWVILHVSNSSSDLSDVGTVTCWILWFVHSKNPFSSKPQAQASNYTSVKDQCPSICSVSNNLIGRGLVDVVDVMHAQLTFRRHNKTPSFGGSPVNCLNDINQLDIYLDKRYLGEDSIRMANLLLVIHSPISGNMDAKYKI